MVKINLVNSLNIDDYLHSLYGNCFFRQTHSRRCYLQTVSYLPQKKRSQSLTTLYYSKDVKVIFFPRLHSKLPSATSMYYQSWLLRREDLFFFFYCRTVEWKWWSLHIREDYMIMNVQFIIRDIRLIFIEKKMKLTMVLQKKDEHLRWHVGTCCRKIVLSYISWKDAKWCVGSF